MIYREFIIDTSLYKTAIDDVIARFSQWFNFTKVEITGIWTDSDGLEIFADNAGIELNPINKLAKVDGEWLEPFPVRGESKIRISGNPINDDDPCSISEAAGVTIQKYVDEFVFRYNTRGMSENFRFDAMLNNINSRLTYEQLTSAK